MDPYVALAGLIVGTVVGLTGLVGAAVHMRRGTVNTSLVRWLMIGSVPSAFLGVFILRSLGGSEAIQTDIEYILGGALLVASMTMVVKWTLDRRRGGRGAADVRN